MCCWHLLATVLLAFIDSSGSLLVICRSTIFASCACLLLSMQLSFRCLLITACFMINCVLSVFSLVAWRTVEFSWFGRVSRTYSSIYECTHAIHAASSCVWPKLVHIDIGHDKLIVTTVHFFSWWWCCGCLKEVVLDDFDYVNYQFPS